jgi:hypothetical protein
MSAFREILKKNQLAQNLVAFARFLRAYRVYKRTGQTPETGYLSMRVLYFGTNGRFNNWFVKWEALTRRKPTIVVGEPRGVIGDLSQGQVQSIVQDIEENGYHVFANRLSPELCDELVRFATTTPFKPRLAGASPLVYNSATPIANVYDMGDSQTLFNSPAVQKIISDPSLLAVASGYLGEHTYLQNIQMWWSNANASNVNLSAAAQLFHADLDAVKWIKIFFYLTDVDEHNGPHCYIAKSHKHKPKSVRHDGRITDDELAQAYPASDFRELVGPCGTGIAADTIGFHKGKPLERGERLILQMTYATSFFGYGMPSKVTPTASFTPEFREWLKKNKDVYAGYLQN